MGHRKRHAPKRGSLAYLPRGRASSQVGRIRYWPDVEGEARLLAFPCYKAGMTHSYILEDDPKSPSYGKEVFAPVTVLDTPPALVVGLRVYAESEQGLRCLHEVWAENLPKDLGRVFTMPKKHDLEGMLKKVEGDLPITSEVRAILCTQPRQASVRKKKPEVIEVKVGGGSIEGQVEYVKGGLGKPSDASSILRVGQYVDVSAVTKGKGFQGVVKRWGVHLLSHKSRKRVRGVGTLGPWKPPRVLYTVPRAGQMGYHQRIEYNKRILSIGADGSEASPKGGFNRYGALKGAYILLKGSTPGPCKRLVELRQPARPPAMGAQTAPTITFLRA